MARILVVEDEPIIAEMLMEWLQDLGHEAVGPAATVIEALRLVETQIDAVILDYSLGREPSFPIAERLSQRGIPFAFATGHTVATIDPAYAAAANLIKPFGFEAFRKAVDAIAPGQKSGVDPAAAVNDDLRPR